MKKLIVSLLIASSILTMGLHAMDDAIPEQTLGSDQIFAANEAYNILQNYRWHRKNLVARQNTIQNAITQGATEDSTNPIHELIKTQQDAYNMLTDYLKDKPDVITPELTPELMLTLLKLLDDAQFSSLISQYRDLSNSIDTAIQQLSQPADGDLAASTNSSLSDSQPYYDVREELPSDKDTVATTVPLNVRAFDSHEQHNNTRASSPNHELTDNKPAQDTVQPSASSTAAAEAAESNPEHLQIQLSSLASQQYVKMAHDTLKKYRSEQTVYGWNLTIGAAAPRGATATEIEQTRKLIAEWQDVGETLRLNYFLEKPYIDSSELTPEITDRLIALANDTHFIELLNQSHELLCKIETAMRAMAELFKNPLASTTDVSSTAAPEPAASNPAPLQIQLPYLTPQKKGWLASFRNWIWPQVPTLEITQKPISVSHRGSQNLIMYTSPTTILDETTTFMSNHVNNVNSPEAALTRFKKDVLCSAFQRCADNNSRKNLVARTANARSWRAALATTAAIGFGAQQVLKNMRFIHAKILAVPLAITAFVIAKPLAGYCNRRWLDKSYDDSANQKVREDYLFERMHNHLIQ